IAGAVVGVVEALPLEMDRRGVEHALDGYARIGVGGESLVAERLLDLECGPVRAPVLVNRHRYTDYKSPVVAPTEWQRGGGARRPVDPHGKRGSVRRGSRRSGLCLDRLLRGAV